MMLLSFLIPTYNYKCYTLVETLHQQLELSDVEYEIIVAEDGSKDQVKVISNLRINELSHCHHIRRMENVGRAAIRNFLIKEAKGEWCIVIDSDAEVVSDDFVQRYIDATKSVGDVFVGGLVNPPTLPSPDVSLRYKYEKAYEFTRTIAYREQNPYLHFSTFNFMAKRSVLENIKFDESCKEYGYEDALMGVELQLRNKKIKHIDNPLMHVGFESNKVFLSKSETALRTLKSLGDKMIINSHVGQFALKANHWHIAWLFKVAFIVFKPMLQKNLLGNNPNIKAFSFYKLGYYLNLK